MKLGIILFFLLTVSCTIKTAHFTLTDPIWVEEKKIVDIDTIHVRDGRFKVVKYRKSLF